MHPNVPTELHKLQSVSFSNEVANDVAVVVNPDGHLLHVASVHDLLVLDLALLCHHHPLFCVDLPTDDLSTH
jgi:hypothetical protein